jgi:hypothetical protein
VIETSDVVSDYGENKDIEQAVGSSSDDADE